MVDLSKIPTRNELTPQVQSSVGASDYAALGRAWSNALGAIGDAAVEVGTPMAEEAGRKAVVRDENGALKVEMQPIVGRLGDVALQSAKAAFSVQAQTEIERNLLELRNKTWQPVEQGGGGGDPKWFDQASNAFITKFAGQHRGGFQDIARQMGLRVAGQHAQALVSQRERLDVKNQSDVLKGREEELRSRLATLAFDNGTDSDEFRSTVAEMKAIRTQRAADPRFGYSPAEAEMDSRRDADTLRGMAIVGQARRDYQATGDLAGAQRRAEEALVASGVPVEERGKMLGQINSHLAGMSAVKQQQKQELRDQALEIEQRMQRNEPIPEAEIGKLIGGMVGVGMHADARRLAVRQATQFGTSLIQSGMTPEQRLQGINQAREYQGVQVPQGQAGNTLNVARMYMGMSEGNPADVTALSEFMKKSGGHSINPATTAWCAGFVDAVLGQGGFRRRGSLRASDFLDYGTPTDKPSAGDVVVFKPQSAGASGHVGFVVSVDGDQVRYIAGNDSNKVQEATLPASEVAGYRIPPRAGTPVQGVTDATAPAATQQRATALGFGSSYVGSVALNAAVAANDAIIKQQLDAFEKSFDLPGGGPSRDQVAEMLANAPMAGGAELRERLKNALMKNEARLGVTVDPAGIRAAITALEQKAVEGEMPLAQRQALKMMQDAVKEQDKEIAAKPFRAGSRMPWDGEAAPRTMKAASAPLDFSNGETLRTQIEARSTASQLLEARTGRGASSLMDADDAQALRDAGGAMPPDQVLNVFRSLAATRKETLEATLSDKGAREALVGLTKTSDPAKFGAAMQGLDILMRRDERAFLDAMDKDITEKVLKWRDTLGLASDPKQIEAMMNPAVRGKEGEIAKAQRGKGEKLGREMDDKELYGLFHSFTGRLMGSNPDQFIEPGAGQDRAIPLPQNALRADLANAMGEFMASGMSEEKAKEAAVTILQKTWSVSQVTGQIMKYAPDRIYQKHFGFTASEMDKEVQDALHAVAGKPMTDEAASVLGRERIKYTLVPDATTQSNFKAWQDWENAGQQGPPPPAPRYQVLYEDKRSNPPQLRMVENDRGAPMLFRWDVSKKRQAQEAEFRARQPAQEPVGEVGPMNMVP